MFLGINRFYNFDHSLTVADVFDYCSAAMFLGLTSVVPYKRVSEGLHCKICFIAQLFFLKSICYAGRLKSLLV
jgi:hypothetical protein